MRKILGLTFLLLVMFVFCLHGYIDKHSTLGLVSVASTGASLLYVLGMIAINWQDLF